MISIKNVLSRVVHHLFQLGGSLLQGVLFFFKITLVGLKVVRIHVVVVLVLLDVIVTLTRQLPFILLFYFLNLLDLFGFGK